MEALLWPSVLIRICIFRAWGIGNNGFGYCSIKFCFLDVMANGNSENFFILVLCSSISHLMFGLQLISLRLSNVGYFICCVVICESNYTLPSEFQLSIHKSLILLYNLFMVDS